MESDCELEIFVFGNQVFTGVKDTGGICYTNSVLLKGVNLGGKFFIVFIMVKDMKKKDLQKAAGISATSITKLGKNENVNTEIIEKICTALHCDVCDIMEMIDDQ